MLSSSPIIMYTVGFFLVALSAKQVGKYFSTYGLPYITGYLLVGAFAGPFILELLPKESIEKLRYIDDISLAIIAFVAGSELYLKEVKSRLKTILLNTTGIIITAFILIGTTLFILQSFISFTADYPAITKAAVAMLGATILLALSPASTIAVIQEVRAKGPFSKMTLSVTVVMDVLIIVLFALTVTFAGAMINGDSVTFQFLIILLVDILIALLAGYIIGQAIGAMIATPLPINVKIALLILLGYGLFESANYIPTWIYELTEFKIKIEPLLMSMVAGFTVTNFTHQRKAFENILHDITPSIYVAFFTLTGVGLKLDLLIETLNIAFVLFIIRMFSIIVGTYIGGSLANEPKHFRKFAGLGLITQAGIALGLARETAVFFPSTLGSEFATLIISVIVLNEIFGPLLLKFALQQVGESNIPEKMEEKAKRRLLILGVEPQSIALARHMSAKGWLVIVADTDADRVATLAAQDVDERVIGQIDLKTLKTLILGQSDALIAMLDDDGANMAACVIAKEEFGLDDVVVRLRDVSLRDAFTKIGVRVIDPASAMVHLLDQSVNAPEAVNLLLQQDPDHELVQITILEKAVDGLPLRDLRLPADVLILEIVRDGHTIVPHGFSTLRLTDKITMIGSPKSLAEVTFKLGR